LGKKEAPLDGITVGLIADTHGLLRKEALAALAGVERILHAGDIGGLEVIAGLERIAPVVAVRGNCDRGEWAGAYPETEVVAVGGVLIYLLHDLHRLDLDAGAAGFRAVVSGHSHQAASAERDGVLYINPGSAGPRRFKLPVSLALLRIDDGTLRVEWVRLPEPV
jgi:putative phosphoesterase